MNALLHEIVANGWYDEEYVAAHTLGFEELRSVVEEYPPEKVSLTQRACFPRGA
jgi:ferredoxin-nitrate reductase